MTTFDENPSIRAVVSFAEIKRKFAQDYRSIEVRLLAAKQKRKSHILLAGEAILRAKLPEDRGRSRFETESVLDQHYWLTIKDLHRLEVGLSHGVVLGSNPPVKVKTGAPDTEQSLNPPQINFQSLRQRFDRRNQVVDRRFTLTWMGAMPSQILGPTRMDSLEKDLPGGYSRLPELVSAIIRGAEAARDRASCFEIAVPMLVSAALVRKGELIDGVFQIEGDVDHTLIQAFVRELDQRLGHRHLNGDPISVRLEELKWEKSESARRARFSHKLRPELSGELQIKYRGEEWIEDLHDPEALARAGAASKALFGTGAPSPSSLGLDGLTLPAVTEDAKRREVFLVHGRNKEAVEQMNVFLTSLDLKIIDWTRAVGLTGTPNPYIGQVIDAAMERAQAIIVLLTGDDEAVLREGLRESNDGPQETQPQAQPRMNVIFEAGLAQGRFRDRTLLIQIGKVKMLSDILGQHVPRVSEDPEWRKDVIERLRKAGCAVDDANPRWLKAGDFSKVLTHAATVPAGVPPAPAPLASPLLAGPRHGFLPSLVDVVHPNGNAPSPALMLPLAITNEVAEPSALKGLSLEGEIRFPAAKGLIGPHALVKRHCKYLRDARTTELIELPLKIAGMDTVRCTAYFDFPRDAWEGLAGTEPGTKEIALRLETTDIAGRTRITDSTVPEAPPA